MSNPRAMELIMEYTTEFLAQIERTPASVSFRFQRPAEFNFTAGQYMLVNLGNELVHPLSLSSCPEETEFIEFTKRMSGSAFSRRLQSLTRGENIKVKGPAGGFCCEESLDSLVLIAGGIGITPVRSILKSFEMRGRHPFPITLLYGNLDKGDIAFREELENLSLPDYRLVHVLVNPAGVENAYQGFITADIISREVPDTHFPRYMVSGPPAMVEAMKKALATLEVPDEQIRTDVFFGYD